MPFFLPVATNLNCLKKCYLKEFQGFYHLRSKILLSRSHLTISNCTQCTSVLVASAMHYLTFAEPSFHLFVETFIYIYIYILSDLKANVEK